MVYITTKRNPDYKQMSLEELLFGTYNEPNNTQNLSSTRTYIVDEVKNSVLDRININELINILHEFNTETDMLQKKDRHSLYNTFHIPKKQGGLRKIDAPNPELKEALNRLKTIFEVKFGALYHTSAYAYIKNRCTIDAIKKHQSNESKWFGKYDLSDFFGNTTLDFVLSMFSMIFPFSEVMKDKQGRKELSLALSLAFLDGGLPQGTPISPLITNIMMIPIDHKLSNSLRDFEGQCYIYTRYADDFIISCKYSFDHKKIEKYIKETLELFNAPFEIKSQKTRYGSSAGSNWNLGVMLNKDNDITIGYKNKKRFKTMLFSYVMDKKNKNPWDRYDVQVLEGLRNYYRSVEKNTIDKIVNHIGSKLNVNIVNLIREDLKQ